MTASSTLAGAGPAYAGIMILAILTAVILKRRGDRALPLPASQRWGIALGAFCGAMIGSKLPFVMADWDGLVSGRAWFDNGKTILFGLVGGYFGVEMAKSILGVTIKTGDSFAVPVAAAVSVGRLACFVGGCCFGKPTGLPWGVVFHDGIPRHPTQLYEAAFHASAAVFLAWTERRGLFRFQRIKLYLIAYLVLPLPHRIHPPGAGRGHGPHGLSVGIPGLDPGLHLALATRCVKISIEFIHMLAAVRGISDQRVRPHVHDEVQVLQRQLTDEDRGIVRNFHDVHRAVSPLDGQPHSIVNGGFCNADAASHPFLVPLVQAKLADEPCR